MTDLMSKFHETAFAVEYKTNNRTAAISCERFQVALRSRRLARRPTPLPLLPPFLPHFPTGRSLQALDGWATYISDLI